MPGPKFLSAYHTSSHTWDEMMADDNVRQHYQIFFESLRKSSITDLTRKDELAKKLFMSQGITFTVYSDGEGIEKIFPFDIIPRIITGAEWAHIEAGIRQRLKALNLFLKDIYHEQAILHDNLIPAALIHTCSNFLKEMVGVDVPFGIYTHIAGIDLIRDSDGSFYVLEDNLRTPSGVSYMLENRNMTYRIFPGLLPQNNVRSIKDYPDLLLKNLMALSNRQKSNPTVVLLTPGIFNSAYFEHTTLARLMGVELVEGKDLVVNDAYVYMRTTAGLKQVDVIYRRVDDEFLDPLVFNPTSMLGVSGLYYAYRKGNVAIINAPGNGVADDKAVYTYVPQMIKYYLNEEPILKTVPTYYMDNREHFDLVFSQVHKMVIKKTNESGGYGMLMGHSASDQQIAEYKIEVEKNPRKYIAQPMIQLSSVPCFINNQIQPRHVDLRPFALYSPSGIEIVPGGLTRVALREGSLVVNSSQGGGSKDTWVLG